jgi:hypothetical protein
MDEKIEARSSAIQEKLQGVMDMREYRQQFDQMLDNTQVVLTNG